MPFPIDMSRCLAFVPPDQPVEIRGIASERVRHACAEHGLHPGDRVSRTQAAGDRVVLKRADGAAIEVEREIALFVEVRPL